MSNLLEQYEEQSSQCFNAVEETLWVEARHIHRLLEKEEDTPIFVKQRINFKPPKKITNLLICNNQLIANFNRNIIQLRNLANPDRSSECTISDSVSAIFMDDTGSHFFIATGTEISYSSTKSLNFYHIPKLKGQKITSVCFVGNIFGNMILTCLMGNDKGVVYELNLKFDTPKRSLFTPERMVKNVYSLVHQEPVCGIECFKMNRTEDKNYFVLILTPQRLYHYVGKITTNSLNEGVFTSLFGVYSDPLTNDLETNFKEFSIACDRSQFRVYCHNEDDLKHVAWMAGPGVYLTTINSINTDKLQFTQNRLINYPQDRSSLKSDVESNPISIALTQYHLLIMFQTHVCVINILSGQLVFKDNYLEQFGVPIGIWRDPIKGTIWSYTNSSIFRYKVVNEDRDVWKIYLLGGNFDKALQACKNDPVKKNEIYSKQANFLFEQGSYEESLKAYAKCSDPLEGILLNFMKLKDKKYLKSFLILKLNSLKPNQKAQITSLLIWIVEIFMTQLDELRNSTEEENYKNMLESFSEFIKNKRIKECGYENRTVFYELLAEHGNIDIAIEFAKGIDDYEHVIQFLIAQNRFDDAVNVIAEQADVRLHYKFSPILLNHRPKEIFLSLKDLGPYVDVRRLMPSFEYQTMKSNSTELIHQVIDYLEFCVHNLEEPDKSVHNFLFSLYVKHAPEKLDEYLRKNAVATKSSIKCDIYYVIRLLEEKCLYKELVYVYSVLELYEEAITVALKFSVDVAKQCAKECGNEAVKLKLWTIIAKHVISTDQENIADVLSRLPSEFPLLSVKHLLKLCPKDLRASLVAKPVYKALKVYSNELENLKMDMENSSNDIESIKKDISTFRERCITISFDSTCCFCQNQLLSRPFYCFPCTHNFHTDCLAVEVFPLLPPDLKERMNHLHHQIAFSPSVTENNSAKKELDELLAAQCPYCSDLTIDFMHCPLLSADDSKRNWE